MVSFYSGTPGSGKSFHTARDIRDWLRRRRNVISTVDIDTNRVSSNGRRSIGDFKYIPITELKVIDLYRYAARHHVPGKEGQTLIVIDECQIIFDSRQFQQKERRDWILFFSRHRHFGFEVILISQQDRMIDRQIRGLFEYEYKHRKVNNFGFAWMIPITFFVIIRYWYSSRLRIDAQFMRYKRRIGKIYNSYAMFEEFLSEFREMQSEYAEEAEEREAREDAKEVAHPLTHGGGGGGTPPPCVRGEGKPTLFRWIKALFTRKEE